MKRLEEVKAFLFDMDGTIYLGDQLVPGAPAAIEKCRNLGKKILFLTNNSSKSPEDYRKKLESMGISASREEIMTSGDVAVEYLRDQKIFQVFLLGTPALEKLFQRQGFKVDPKNPEMVVLGFDTTLTYAKLERACLLIQQGIPWIATHPDLVCPREDGFIPDCGAMAALLEKATGTPPQAVLGKPSSYLIKQALQRLGTEPSETAIVGDRLYTDIAMGEKGGLVTILVFSGEASLSDLESSPFQPDLHFPSVCQLGEALC